MQPALAVGSPAVADDLLVLHGAHLVVVVPTELLPGGDELESEEGNTGEPEVMAVHKHILHKYIRVAAVIQISANISLGHCIHYVNIFIRAKIFTNRFMFWLITGVFFWCFLLLFYRFWFFWKNFFQLILVI